MGFGDGVLRGSGEFSVCGVVLLCHAGFIDIADCPSVYAREIRLSSSGFLGDLNVLLTVLRFLSCLFTTRNMKARNLE